MTHIYLIEIMAYARKPRNGRRIGMWSEHIVVILGEIRDIVVILGMWFGYHIT